MVLICIFWWLAMLTCACWPSVFPLWKNVYSVLLPIFKLDLCVCVLSCMSCLYMLDINPLSVISFANIFSSHSVGCLVVLLMVSFAVQKLLSLKWPRLKIWWKCIIMQMTRKFCYFWDIHFKVITTIMTYNIIPEHIRFVGISCNVWNIYINIFPYK